MIISDSALLNESEMLNVKINFNVSCLSLIYVDIFLTNKTKVMST